VILRGLLGRIGRGTRLRGSVYGQTVSLVSLFKGVTISILNHNRHRPIICRDTCVPLVINNLLLLGNFYQERKRYSISDVGYPSKEDLFTNDSVCEMRKTAVLLSHRHRRPDLSTGRAHRAPRQPRSDLARASRPSVSPPRHVSSFIIILHHLSPPSKTSSYLPSKGSALKLSKPQRVDKNDDDGDGTPSQIKEVRNDFVPYQKREELLAVGFGSRHSPVIQVVDFISKPSFF
jgi:hypothetical protein